MKKKLILLAMLVSMLALSLTFLSCDLDPKLELNGTTWVNGLTKAELAAEMKTTETLLDASLAVFGVTINFPLPVAKLEFTSDKDFKLSYNNSYSSLETIGTVTWSETGSGTYTIDGDDVTLKYPGGTQTGTVDGNTLTVTVEGKPIKYQKQ